MTRSITKRAVEQAGGAKAVAELVGVSRQAVEQWERVPPKHVLRIEQASGISRYELRPDIYGDRPSPLDRLSSAQSVAA